MAITASLSVALAGCAQRISALPGVAPLNPVLPSFALPPSPEKLTFRWEMNDNSIVARGDGVARLGPPDHARVDLFLGGGFGAAAAILSGDSLIVPPGSSGRDLVPPAPLLWAALGRLALPAVPDTIIRVSGDTLRASLGAPVQWRITSVAGQLTRVERVSGDRIVEWVERIPGKRVHYELSGRRSLVLDIETHQPVPQFDASIWRF
ncbi:MAG: hypothetical protein ABI194_00745 [Gemmatimonadaceae bacterium]